MTRTDYPLSLNPSCFPSPIEKSWTREVRNIEDKGEGYNAIVTFWLSDDWKQIEIMNVRAVGVDVQPSDQGLKETARAYLQSEFGDKIEFV